MKVLNEFSNPNVVGFYIQENTIESEVDIIEDTGDVCRFNATLQSCDIGNRNRRKYPYTVLREAILSPNIQERLETRTLYGECSHPFSEDINRQMVVDLKRVSHLITSLSVPAKKNDLVTGVVETAATSAGKDMYGLITKNKSRVAFSMRGFGNVRRDTANNLDEVTGKLALIGWDWVTYPSHKEAYMRLKENGGIVPVTRTDLEKFIMHESGNVRAILESFNIDNPSISLTEDKAAAIIKDNNRTIKTFLESNLRAEFRSVL
jgi:hypothetical protein